MWIYSPLLPVAADTGLSAGVGNIQVGAGTVAIRAGRRLAAQGANIAVGAGTVTLAPNWLRVQVSWAEISFARTQAPRSITATVGGISVGGGSVSFSTDQRLAAGVSDIAVGGHAAGLTYTTSGVVLTSGWSGIVVGAGGDVGLHRGFGLTALPADIRVGAGTARILSGFPAARVSWAEVRFATEAPRLTIVSRNISVAGHAVSLGGMHRLVAVARNVQVSGYAVTLTPGIAARHELFASGRDIAVGAGAVALCRGASLAAGARNIAVGAYSVGLRYRINPAYVPNATLRTRIGTGVSTRRVAHGVSGTVGSQIDVTGAPVNAIAGHASRRAGLAVTIRRAA